MSWRARDAEEDEPRGRGGASGGDWQGVRPTFDNPLSWSLPLGSVARIAIRAHLFLLVFVAVELLRAALAAPTKGQPVTLDTARMLMLLACLCWNVLLHEFGHCFACRAGGGEADEVLLWPLGGLAWCRPAPSWQAHLATAAGGPLVNLAMLAIAAPSLGLATGKWIGVALPSPFHLGGLIDVSASWWLTLLYLFVWTNLVLLLFNLLPLFPLDGGRMLQALLWPRLGWSKAMRASVRVGYAGAVALGVLGLVQQEVLLLVVAGFGGFVCWRTLRETEFTDREMGYESEQAVEAPTSHEHREERAVQLERDSKRDALLKAQQEEAAELDRILAKINSSGLESLSTRERRLLKEATDRRRKEP